GLIWLLDRPSQSTPSRIVVPIDSGGSRTARVDYTVSGSARSASLTYVNETGGTEQISVRLPWQLRMDVPGGTYVAVSAQNNGETGSVTCTIQTDLEPFKTSTSQGAYKIASCNGLVP